MWLTERIAPLLARAIHRKPAYSSTPGIEGMHSAKRKLTSRRHKGCGRGEGPEDPSMTDRKELKP